MRILQRIIYVFVCSLFTLSSLFSQEKIHLTTAQNILVLGDVLWYEANLQATQADYLPMAQLRTELVSPSGQVLQTDVLTVTQGRVTGSFSIPAKANEGRYRLRAYSIWNPGRKIGNLAEYEFSVYDDFKIRTLEVSEEEVTASKFSLSQNPNGLRVATDKITRRGNVEIDITNVPLQNASIAVLSEADAVLSAAHASEVFHQEFSENFANRKPEEVGTAYAKLDIDLSKNQLLGVGVKFPETIDMQWTSANAEGVFSFIKSKSMNSAQVFALFAADVSTAVPVASKPVNLSKDISARSNQMDLVVNAHVLKYLEQSRQRRKYQSIFDLPTNRVPVSVDMILSNDAAEDSYLVKNYAAMTELKEFLREVIPFVQVKERKGKAQFRILNTDKSFFSEAPMFIVDGWLMSDISGVLDIEMEDIIRVDIYRAKQELKKKFGVAGKNGVIAIYTNNKEIGAKRAKKLPKLNFRETPVLQKFMLAPITGERLPDFRSLVYYNENSTLENGSAKVSFPHSDDMGTFIIFVKGQDEKGEVVVYTAKYKVN